MSIQTQAILPRHFTIDALCAILRAECGIAVITVRQMTRPEYQIVEFIDLEGGPQAMSVFLDSWAADDYADTHVGDSTLLTLEFSPNNFGLLATVTSATGGYLRRVSGDVWKPANVVAS